MKATDFDQRHVSLFDVATKNSCNVQGNVICYIRVRGGYKGQKDKLIEHLKSKPKELLEYQIKQLVEVLEQEGLV